MNVDGGWIGGVLSIEPSNGYWLIMNNDETLSVTGYPIGSDYEYNLHSGANLLSLIA